MRPKIRVVQPRFEGEALDHGLRGAPTVDDILMVVLATATLLGLLTLIGLSSVSTAARLEAAISRLATLSGQVPESLTNISVFEAVSSLSVR